MSHRLLRLHRGGAVGRSHHLQDKEELRLPAGNEESFPQLRSDIRDLPGRLPVLHPRHGQGPEDVPSQAHLVAPCPAFLCYDLHLR